MDVVVKDMLQSRIPTLHVYNRSGVRRKPVIFMLHGYMEKKESLLEYAYGYAREDYYLVLFDALHHGDAAVDFQCLSEPEKADKFIGILTESAKYIQILVDGNSNNPRADMNRIALIGRSMGGMIIYQYLAHQSSGRIKAAIPCISTPAWGAPFRRYVENTPGAEKYFDEARLEEIERNQPSNFLKNLSDLPLLMMIGEKDPRMNAEDMQVFYASLLPNYVDKEKLRLEVHKGVGHAVTAEMLQKMLLWIKKYLS